jgi:hypothetical protein
MAILLGICGIQSIIWLRGLYTVFHPIIQKELQEKFEGAKIHRWESILAVCVSVAVPTFLMWHYPIIFFEYSTGIGIIH